MSGKNIGIIGAGSFGIALAYLLENNGHSVRVWTRSPENTKRFSEERGNLSKLPGVTLKSASFTCDMGEALDDADEAVLDAVVVEHALEGLAVGVAEEATGGDGAS